jgi:predicted O-linked N-acetylglucosamine transferase (SPINDLY family)
MTTPSAIPDGKQQARTLLQARRLPEAHALLTELTCAHPHDAEAWFLLGAANGQLGRLEEAIRCFTECITRDPGRAEAYRDRAQAQLMLNRPDLAEADIKHALMLRPDAAEFHAFYGSVSSARGSTEQAQRQYERALEIDPRHMFALMGLGTLRLQEQRYSEAVQLLREAARNGASHPAAHINLGNAYEKLGELDNALASYRHARSLWPSLAVAHFSEGTILAKLGDLDGAAACMREALARQPDYIDALNNLGFVYIRMRKRAEAIECLRKVVRINPAMVAARNNLAIVLWQEGHLEEAADCLREALRSQPDLGEAHNNLGNVLREQGQVQEAVECFRQTFERWPDYHTSANNMLFSLHYLSGQEPDSLFARHKQWGDSVAGRFSETQRWTNIRDPDRRLRIGYVSPDFWTHSVSCFFEPLLMQHDAQKVEITCYANVDQEDATTLRLKSAAHHWRKVNGLNEEQLAAQIRADGIDILVDLAGHTAGNRLLAFARRPAPVQVTYLGYPATTGLPTIDYRFTDAEADPLGETERFHTEELVRLPHGFLCYQPRAEADLPVRPPPCTTAGHVTFGSFNNLPKTTPAVVALWARILHAVPGSRLVMKNRSFQDAATRERYAVQFAGHGIASDRLTFAGRIASVDEHLTWYHRLDIALDPFPYNGTTTTCEALWMGVPVITLAGRLHAGRVGVSLLTRVGLPELIAGNEDDYIQRAVELANAPDRLQTLRATLRQRLRASSLCDGPGFARDVEAAYREMWRRWCSRCDTQHDGEKHHEPE